MSPAVFLNGQMDSQIDDLASYISKLRKEDGDEDSPYMKEINALLAANKDNEVHVKLAEDASIFLTRVDRYVEGAFNLCIIIALNAPNQETVVKTLIKTLTTTESNMVSLKQKILLNLYNALPESSLLRYDAFVGLLDVTAEADELDSLYPHLEHIDAWAKKWGADQTLERNLFKHISEKLKEAGEEKLSLDFFLKYLATYDDNAVLAKEAILRAVNMENYFAFEELLQYAPIQRLKGTPEFQLLDVFLNGNLATYKEFTASHSDLITNGDSNIQKMRLLSLASLGSENLSRELSYAEIADSLKISEDEVEMWVIDVIRAGLVEAKLDQLNKTVIIHRSIYRVFGKEEWQQLSNTLNQWKTSLKDILAVTANARQSVNNALHANAISSGGDEKHHHQ